MVPHGARKVKVYVRYIIHVYDTVVEIGEKGFREPISRELENENVF